MFSLETVINRDLKNEYFKNTYKFVKSVTINNMNNIHNIHVGRTADMTENRQYWKMMVKTGPQRSGDGL